MMIGPIGFAAPWLLVALALLPVLWVLLRAVPPAPVRRRFPGVALLLGLKDDDSVTDRTPWWLLLLRMLAVAAVIIGLAGPVLNPKDDATRSETGPLLIVMDASWASATDWPQRKDVLERVLSDTARAERPVGNGCTMSINNPPASYCASNSSQNPASPCDGPRTGII